MSLKDRRAQPNDVPNVAGGPVIKRVLHALLSKSEKLTYFEIRLTGTVAACGVLGARGLSSWRPS